VSQKISKSQARVLKQQEDVEKKKTKAVRFVATLGKSVAKELKFAPIPLLETKAVKFLSAPIELKQVSIPAEGAFNLDYNMTWCRTKSDVEGRWSWYEERLWTDEEWAIDILPSFKSLETSTWHEILYEHKVSAKRGKRVLKNHPQEIASLVEEAQSRWVDLGLDEFDTAFRFRFGGTVRAWGIKLQGHFFLIWWERNHKIYPV
jgi:hypothetical protein